MTPSVAKAPRRRLERVSALLMLTTLLNAVLGLGFWLAAARLYDADAVGLAAGAVSALTLVSSFGWFGLQHVLLRYVPIAGARRGALVLRVYLLALVIALLSAAGFLALLTGPFDAELLSSSPLAVSAFLAAVVAWVAFSLQDPALIALGQEAWVPVENAVFGLLKLVAIVALAAAGATSAWAIFGAWAACAGVLVVVISWLLTRRLLPAARDAAADLPSSRAIARFAAGHHFVAVTAALPDFLVPLLVLGLLSEVATAHYYAAFTMSYALRLLAVNIASALTVEGARDRAALGALVRRVARLVGLLLVPLAVLTAAVANPMLALFGGNYSGDGAGLLRLFALTLPLSAVVVVGLAIERVRQRSARAFAVAVVSAGATIGLDFWLLPARGLQGAGIAWLIGQALGAALTAALILRAGAAPAPQDAEPAGPAMTPVLAAAAPDFPEAAVPAAVVSPRLARTHPGVPVALLAGAVLVSLAGVLGADLRLDDLGLVRSLPAPYFLALAVLPIATALEAHRPAPRTWMLAAPVVAFVVIVWLTPLMLEGTPRFRTAYQSWSYVDPLLTGDGLRPQRFIYHNWPLFPGLFAGIQQVTGLRDTTIMAAFPLTVMLAWLALVVALVRTLAPTAGPVGWALGAWAMAVFSWTNQDYFSPQALAFVLFLALMLVLARAARDGGRLGQRGMAAALTLYTLIVATHALTSMIALALVAALTITRILRRPALIILFALMFVAWQADVADPFYTQYGPRLRETLLAASDFLQVNAASRVSGSPEHLTVTRARILVSLAAFGLAAVAALVSRARRREPAWRFAMTCLVALAIVTPVSAYGGEMLIRALLFALPMIVALVVIAQPRGRLLAAYVALLVVLTPLHILTHYGNEAYDHVSQQEIDGFRFFAELAPARIYGGYPAGAFVNSTDLQWRNGVVPNASRPPLASAFLNPRDQHWERRPLPTYVALSRGDEAAARMFAGRPDFVTQVRRAIQARPAEFVEVYHNRDITIWRQLNPAGRP